MSKVCLCLWPGRSVLFPSITKENCLGFGRSSAAGTLPAQKPEPGRRKPTVTSKISTEQSEPRYSTMSRHQNLCVLAMSRSCTDEVERPAYTPGLQSIPMEEGTTKPDVQVPPSHAGSPGPSGVLVPGTPPPPNSALGRESWGQLFSRPCSEHVIRSDLNRATQAWRTSGLEGREAPECPLLPAQLLPGLRSCIT